MQPALASGENCNNLAGFSIGKPRSFSKLDYSLHWHARRLRALHENDLDL